mgnify:CR=1 FL=1
MAGELARIIGDMPEKLGGLLDEACDIRAQGRRPAGAVTVVTTQLPGGAPGGPAGGMPLPGGGMGNGKVEIDMNVLIELREYFQALRERACDEPQFPYPFCDPGTVNTLQQILLRQCQKKFDDCYLMDVIRAVGDTTWPEVEDQIARSEMYFSIVTTLTGAGLNAKGTSTTFNPVLPIAPGQSVLLVQDLSYPLPWYPDCFWAQLAFNAGTADQNYPHIMFKFWVAPKTQSITSQSQLFEWQKKQKIHGSRVHCGDGCAWTPIGGPSGCGGAFDKVGKDSALFLQIDNLSTATNSISSVDDLIVRFGHMTEPCCDSCKVGKSCGCKK